MMTSRANLASRKSRLPKCQAPNQQHKTLLSRLLLLSTHSGTASQSHNATQTSPETQALLRRLKSEPGSQTNTPPTRCPSDVYTNPNSTCRKGTREEDHRKPISSPCQIESLQSRLQPPAAERQDHRTTPTRPGRC